MDKDLGPTGEASGMVPARCLALVGLVLLPADGELVRGTHIQRQSSPTKPQGRCLFMSYRKGGTYSAAEKKETRGKKENDRGGQ